MRDKAEILEGVCRIVSDLEGIPLDRLAAQTRFVEELHLDSLAAIELVMEVEERFDIDLGEEQADELQTIGQFVDAVAEQLAVRS